MVHIELHNEPVGNIHPPPLVPNLLSDIFGNASVCLANVAATPAIPASNELRVRHDRERIEAWTPTTPTLHF